MQRLTRHLKDPLNLLLIILVVSSLLGAWQFGKHQIGVDYYVAWVAADAVNNDTPHNIYEVPTRYKLALEYRNKADASNSPRQKKMAQWRNELPMTASPFLYWFTGLIAVGDYETDIDVWHAISILSLTLSILVMCRLLGYSTATSLAFLIPVLVWFSPLHIDLQDSNVNSVQLGMIAITLWLLWRGARQTIFVCNGFSCWVDGHVQTQSCTHCPASIGWLGTTPTIFKPCNCPVWYDDRGDFCISDFVMVVR